MSSDDNPASVFSEEICFLEKLIENSLPTDEDLVDRKCICACLKCGDLDDFGGQYLVLRNGNIYCETYANVSDAPDELFVDSKSSLYRVPTLAPHNATIILHSNCSATIVPEFTAKVKFIANNPGKKCPKRCSGRNSVN